MHISYWMLFSLVLVPVNALIARAYSQVEGAAVIAVLLSLPGLPLIWFSEEIGEGRGLRERGFRRVRKPSPGWLAALLGWAWLIGFPLLFVHQTGNGLPWQ